MATLNRTEVKIHKAATGSNLFESKVFEEMLNFFDLYSCIIDDNHCKLINYLYRENHKGKTFDTIARLFNRSVSTLEDNRRCFQKIFLAIYNKLKYSELTVA